MNVVGVWFCRLVGWDEGCVLSLGIILKVKGVRVL